MSIPRKWFPRDIPQIVICESKSLGAHNDGPTVSPIPYRSGSIVNSSSSRSSTTNITFSPSTTSSISRGIDRFCARVAAQRPTRSFVIAFILPRYRLSKSLFCLNDSYHASAMNRLISMSILNTNVVKRSSNTFIKNIRDAAPRCRDSDYLSLPQRRSRCWKSLGNGRGVCR